MVWYGMDGRCYGNSNFRSIYTHRLAYSFGSRLKWAYLKRCVFMKYVLQANILSESIFMSFVEVLMRFLIELSHQEGEEP
jgi:hypothetical protein